MPLRSDSSVWFNMPGCVAAYQPTRAPGPVLSRYNQAHGGSNAYKALDGVAPTWSAAKGWVFASASDQYLVTGFTAFASNTSMIIRVANADGAIGNCFCGYVYSDQEFSMRMYTGWPNRMLWFYGSTCAYVDYTPPFSGGVLAIAGSVGYKDGVAVVTGLNNLFSNTIQASISIGTTISGTAPVEPYMTGNVSAFAIYNRVLQPSEVWAVTQQMKYCDVNPDWSAWGRRRNWFYYYSAPAGGHIFNPTRHPPISKMGGGL